MNRKAGLVLAFLLALMASLMVGSLGVLVWRAKECSDYEQALLKRLESVPAGSLRAREIRQEIQQSFSGSLRDCSAVERNFGENVDKFLAVVLSLLTGAGISAAAAKPWEASTADRLMDNADSNRID